MGLTVLPLTYISFKLGLPVYMGLLFRNISTFIFMLWRLTYLRERTTFPIEQYVKKVFFKLAIIVPISLLSVYVIHRLIPDTVLAFFISCTASCIILVVLYYFIGISSAERKLVYAFIRKKMKR